MILLAAKENEKQGRFKRSSVQGKNRAAVSTAGSGDNAYTTALHWWCRYISLRWEESCKTVFDKFLKITPKALRFIHFTTHGNIADSPLSLMRRVDFRLRISTRIRSQNQTDFIRCERTCHLCRIDLYEKSKTISLPCLCKNKWKPLFSRQPAQAGECRMAQYAVTDNNQIKIRLLWD